MARRPSRRRRNRSRGRSRSQSIHQLAKAELPPLPLRRVLIAARGEIAARVGRTCRRLGIETVGIKLPGESVQNEDACDETLEIAFAENGQFPFDALVAAAQSANIDMVHLGYVNAHHAALAEKCEAAGLKIAGPHSELHRRCHSLEDIAAAAGDAQVRVLPRSARRLANLPDALAGSDAIGFPVSLRSLGGTDWLSGTLETDDEVCDAWSALTPAQIENGVVIERSFVRPRVIEVTLLADANDRIVLIGERETSLRAENRVILDESPSPALSLAPDGDAFREALFDLAARVLRSARCVGVATVVFLIDQEGRTHVDRIYLGLPEGDAAEMTTGVDLVEWQFRLALGQEIPQSMEFLQPNGHAIVARLISYGPAEPPAAGAEVPAPHWPAAQLGKVWVDMVIEPDGELPTAPNTLLCRMSTYAPVRHQAVLSLDRLLAITEPGPLRHNVPMLRQILSHESFRAGQYDVSFVSRLDGYV